MVPWASQGCGPSVPGPAQTGSSSQSVAEELTMSLDQPDPRWRRGEPTSRATHAVAANDMGVPRFLGVCVWLFNRRSATWKEREGKVQVREKRLRGRHAVKLR